MEKNLQQKQLRKRFKTPKVNVEDPSNFFAEGEDYEISKYTLLNKKRLMKALNESDDLVEKDFLFGKQKQFKATVVFIDGLIDVDLVNESIIKAIVHGALPNDANADLVQAVNQCLLWNGETKVATQLSELVQACLIGDTALFLDGCSSAIIINTKGGERRSILEPQSESVVRGPREGFTETLRTNTALIRRKVRNGKLKVEQLRVGNKTQTAISILYIKNIAKPELVQKVKERLSRINIDSILESGYIEQLIEDNPYSPFATIDYSEKPDVIAGRILEGRVAIVVDGTPFVLTAPMLFLESFQSAEDYYNRPFFASFMRMLRIVAYFISVFGPAMYISLTNFHQELIPTRLLFTVIKSKEGTPFPIFIETLIMVFAFEFLREAGIRLPRSVGQAISIVGALVMGEAAVSAGIVGAPIVIVVAFTAVCGFLMPVQNNSTSILRIIMMILAAFAGWFGISIGFAVLFIHLASLNSFGVPYFDSTSNVHSIKDSLVRVPFWKNNKLPVNLAGKEKTRSGPIAPPNPKEKGGQS